jgi:hypothetical protein
MRAGKSGRRSSSGRGLPSGPKGTARKGLASTFQPTITGCLAAGPGSCLSPPVASGAAVAAAGPWGRAWLR